MADPLVAAVAVSTMKAMAVPTVKAVFAVAGNGLLE